MNYIDKLKSKLSSVKSNFKPIAEPFTEVTQSQVEKIYKFDLSFEIDANEVVNLIYKFRENVPYSNKGKTNVFAWHSDFDTNKKTSDFDPLIEIIKNKLSSLGNKYQPENYDITYLIADSWVGIYNKTEYTIPHAHEPTHYAAVYYAKAEENCSPIVFKNSKKDLEIVPTTNTLLIFSGRTWHYVPKSTSDDERIMFAANFLISYTKK